MKLATLLTLSLMTHATAFAAPSALKPSDLNCALIVSASPDALGPIVESLDMKKPSDTIVGPANTAKVTVGDTQYMALVAQSSYIAKNKMIAAYVELERLNPKTGKSSRSTGSLVLTNEIRQSSMIHVDTDNKGIQILCSLDSLSDLLKK